MPARSIAAIAIAATLAEGRAVHAQRSALRPDLQGTWNGSTMTPLQRPPQFSDRSLFAPEEAAQYVRAFADRLRGGLPTAVDRQMQTDVDETAVEIEQMPLDGLRASLVVDPPNGMLPPFLLAAKARIADRTKAARRRAADPLQQVLVKRMNRWTIASYHNVATTQPQ
jgi:hypothetical protein